MFGELFQCPFVNTTLTETEIPFTGSDMTILLISDTHLGSELDFDQSLVEFIKSLKSLIELVKPTHIIHLGDLVNGTFTNFSGGANFSCALSKMSEFGIPIYVIGGNHDRIYAAQSDFNNEFVTLSQNFSLSLTVPPSHPNGKPTKIYFAHDLGNNYKARAPYSIPFVRWIKAGCKIPASQWLIAGHTHESFLLKRECFSCIGQYSPECNNFAYGILTIKNNQVKFEIKALKSTQYQDNLARQDSSYAYQTIQITK